MSGLARERGGKESLDAFANFVANYRTGDLLWRLVIDAWRMVLPRADLDWLRNRAGGRSNSRLNARLNDASRLRQRPARH